jgi:hypothetical protein
METTKMPSVKPTKAPTTKSTKAPSKKTKAPSIKSTKVPTPSPLASPTKPPTVAGTVVSATIAGIAITLQGIDEFPLDSISVFNQVIADHATSSINDEFAGIVSNFETTVEVTGFVTVIALAARGCDEGRLLEDGSSITLVYSQVLMYETTDQCRPGGVDHRTL